MLVEGGPIRGEEDMTMADRFAKHGIVKHCDTLNTVLLLAAEEA
jgi:hypothetical protein